MESDILFFLSISRSILFSPISIMSKPILLHSVMNLSREFSEIAYSVSGTAGGYVYIKLMVIRYPLLKKIISY